MLRSSSVAAQLAASQERLRSVLLLLLLPSNAIPGFITYLITYLTPLHKCNSSSVPLFHFYCSPPQSAAILPAAYRKFKA
jgi:hypothetical protein